ncbi:MAG: GGDEF domain-containing protein [Candidatus Dormibacteraeota bacterium]|nr:GGDEF domain-containing protein [Candidatus Dormibacteraeota bacterium]
MPGIRALLRSNFIEAPPLRPGALSRSGGLLFGAGAALVLAGLAIERTPGTNWMVVAPALALSFAAATLLLARPDALPFSVYPFLTAAATLLITVVAYSDGSRSSAVVLLYLWAAVYAFYFYSLWLAVLETAWISTASGIELWLRSGLTDWFSHWLLITGTCLVGGLVVRQLVGQVRAEAGRDPLTGLLNRRSMLEHLARDRRRSERTGEPLAVVMLDLDLFKALNDRSGHLEGDRYLRDLAAIWVSELRGGDILARLGGDEFVVVMPDCTLARACDVADRLRSLTTEECTASAGAAEWRAGLGVDELLGAADTALYRAKLAGRNRTEAAVPAP